MKTNISVKKEYLSDHRCEGGNKAAKCQIFVRPTLNTSYTLVQVTRCANINLGVWILIQVSRKCSRYTDISSMSGSSHVPPLHLLIHLPS